MYFLISTVYYLAISACKTAARHAAVASLASRASMDAMAFRRRCSCSIALRVRAACASWRCRALFLATDTQARI